MRRFRFQEGRNCWRQTRAKRLSVLVDGEAYFAAVRRALICARRRIFILAWDIHSEVKLQRNRVQDGYPTELGKLLRVLLERNPQLEIHILLWDYAPIYTLEREPLFFGDSPWDKHPRLHFVTDDTHPLAASHHQKVVVVDGETAFCGGFDLSKWRWDSPEHLARDERRIDTAGKPYPPFHDLQMLVEGETARALETLCRERWQRATGECLNPCETSQTSAWPEHLVPLLQDQNCALARTLPRHQEYPEVREIERLYQDMIRSAERFIYIENQYLTSASIGRALRRRLRQRAGPEIVIILPRETGNWLEQHTMDVLRARLLRPLREDDRHGRLRVYYPSLPDLEEGCLMVHAKLMIVDDRLLRIGSSNLSNRSMGLDTECDLCLRARDEGSRAAVTGLRQRLLGMFLAVDPELVAQAESRESGLISAIESLRSGERTLAPLSGETDPEWERQLPDDRLIDPDRPLKVADLGDAMVGRQALPRAHRRLWLSTGLVMLMLALAAAWRWTDLGSWLDPQALAQSLAGVLHGPWGPGLLSLAYLLGSLIAIPVTLLILLTALIYGPALGAFYALLGSLLAAIATYGLGAYLGGPTVERLSGGSVHRLSERLARRGILTVIAVRIVPVAPFTVINLFAGASRISLRDYLIGTTVGMMPGVAAMAAFSEGILALVQRADLKQFLVAALALVFIIGLTLLARHLFSQLNGRESEQ